MYRSYPHCEGFIRICSDLDTNDVGGAKHGSLRVRGRNRRIKSRQDIKTLPAVIAAMRRVVCIYILYCCTVGMPDCVTTKSRILNDGEPPPDGMAGMFAVVCCEMGNGAGTSSPTPVALAYDVTSGGFGGLGRGDGTACTTCATCADVACATCCIWLVCCMS